jgi:serine/threonine protein kinase
MGYPGAVILEPNAVLGRRYALVRRIAVGGMGEVWEATDTLLDRPVAVKVLKEEFRAASTFLARFRAEARHAGQLSHAGIATVYDYGEDGDMAYLVMELVSGQPLSELMAERPDMPATTKLSILSQAADALHAAHEAGVVHRDVKPGNLMVREDGTVKVTDFGIARALTSAPLTDHGQMIGTPAYVSPEQAAGDTVTGASDIYSLAVVAYELFAGRPLFERDTPLGLTFAHVNDPPPPLPTTVPRPIAELIESALAKDPSQRPASAADMAQRMRAEMAAMRAAPTKAAPTNAAPTNAPPTPTAPRPVPTVVMPASSGPVVGRALPILGPAARLRSRWPSYVGGIAVVGLLVLVGLMWARPWAVDSAPLEPLSSSTSSATAATATSLPPEMPPTSPAPTEPPPTTVPPTTQPPTTVAPTTVAPTTVPTTTQPAPATSAPPAVAPLDGPPMDGEEAVAFVIDYYDRLRAGEYETTWELLSPEFREARNLTFERYVSYWENTTIELRNLRYLSGPGADESRVVFDARYDTGDRIIDETDEITLRQSDDGMIIIRQRTV